MYRHALSTQGDYLRAVVRTEGTCHVLSETVSWAFARGGLMAAPPIVGERQAKSVSYNFRASPTAGGAVVELDVGV
jgi:hypothetical protein